MPDAVLVVFLLAIIWAAVLIPPAAGARAAREAEFLGSLRPDGHPHDDRTGELDVVEQPRLRPALTANARRRQVLGGLLVAIAATLVLGLLPTFRLLLVVHLLLVNSCLAYVGLLVHARDEQAAHARASAKAGWRADRGPAEDGFDEPVHPYASGYSSLAADELEEDYDVSSSRDASTYAYADGYGDEDGYATGEYAYEAYEADADAYGAEAEAYESWDEDDEAAAAYVDEELALRRPA